MFVFLEIYADGPEEQNLPLPQSIITSIMFTTSENNTSVLTDPNSIYEIKSEFPTPLKLLLEKMLLFLFRPDLKKEVSQHFF